MCFLTSDINRAVAELAIAAGRSDLYTFPSSKTMQASRTLPLHLSSIQLRDLNFTLFWLFAVLQLI